MSDEFIVRTMYFDENGEVILTGEEVFDNHEDANALYTSIEEQADLDESIPDKHYLTDLYSVEYYRAPGLKNKTWFILPEDRK